MQCSLAEQPGACEPSCGILGELAANINLSPLSWGLCQATLRHCVIIQERLPDCHPQHDLCPSMRTYVEPMSAACSLIDPSPWVLLLPAPGLSSCSHAGYHIVQSGIFQLGGLHANPVGPYPGSASAQCVCRACWPCQPRACARQVPHTLAGVPLTWPGHAPGCVLAKNKGHDLQELSSTAGTWQTWLGHCIQSISRSRCMRRVTAGASAAPGQVRSGPRRCGVQPCAPPGHHP